MKKKKILGILILLAGLALLIFPFASMVVQDIRQIQADANYSKYSQNNKEELEKQHKEVAELSLDSNGVQDIFSQDKKSASEQKSPYDDVLDTQQSVGRLDLPSIGQNFDLYLDADYDKLARGVATLVGTGAPLGIKGQRPIIAGHRIMYNSMSFYLLPEMQKGDKIYINFLGQDLEYQVFSKEIIDEYDTEKLAPSENEDVITLMTCYNAPDYDQRYLVNARRVDREQEKAPSSSGTITSLMTSKDSKLSIKAIRLAPYLILILALLAMLFFIRKLLQLITEK